MKLTWIVGLAASALPGVAQAHGGIRLSLGLGIAPGYCYPTFGCDARGPRFYAAPAVTYYIAPPVVRYAPPPAVYVAPETVYSAPQVVYGPPAVEAAPPVAYVSPPVVYVSPGPYFSHGYYERRALGRYYRSEARYRHGR